MVVLVQLLKRLDSKSYRPYFVRPIDIWFTNPVQIYETHRIPTRFESTQCRERRIFHPWQHWEGWELGLIFLAPERDGLGLALIMLTNLKLADPIKDIEHESQNIGRFWPNLMLSGWL